MLRRSDVLLGNAAGIGSVAIHDDVIAAQVNVFGSRDEPTVYLWLRGEFGWVDATEAVQLPNPVFFLGLGDVAVLSNAVAVGMPNYAGGNGAVFVWNEPAAGWLSSDSENLAKHLTASDAQFGDGLGTSLAISDNRIVAGAPCDDAEAVLGAPAGRWGGAAHRFQRGDPPRARADRTSGGNRFHDSDRGGIGS